MGLPNKKTLTKLYPRWNIHQQNRMKTPIEIVYGKAFLIDIERLAEERRRGRIAPRSRFLKKQSRSKDQRLVPRRYSPRKQRRTESVCSDDEQNQPSGNSTGDDKGTRDEHEPLVTSTTSGSGSGQQGIIKDAPRSCEAVPEKERMGKKRVTRLRKKTGGSLEDPKNLELESMDSSDLPNKGSDSLPRKKGGKGPKHGGLKKKVKMSVDASVISQKRSEDLKSVKLESVAEQGSHLPKKARDLPHKRKGDKGTKHDGIHKKVKVSSEDNSGRFSDGLESVVERLKQSSSIEKQKKKVESKRVDYQSQHLETKGVKSHIRKHGDETSKHKRQETSVHGDIGMKAKVVEVFSTAGSKEECQFEDAGGLDVNSGADFAHDEGAINLQDGEISEKKLEKMMDEKPTIHDDEAKHMEEGKNKIRKPEQSGMKKGNQKRGNPSSHISTVNQLDTEPVTANPRDTEDISDKYCDQMVSCHDSKTDQQSQDSGLSSMTLIEAENQSQDAVAEKVKANTVTNKSRKKRKNKNKNKNKFKSFHYRDTCSSVAQSAIHQDTNDQVKGQGEEAVDKHVDNNNGSEERTGQSSNNDDEGCRKIGDGQIVHGSGIVVEKEATNKLIGIDQDTDKGEISDGTLEQESMDYAFIIVDDEPQTSVSANRQLASEHSARKKLLYDTCEKSAKKASRSDSSDVIRSASPVLHETRSLKKEEACVDQGSDLKTSQLTKTDADVQDADIQKAKKKLVLSRKLQSSRSQGIKMSSSKLTAYKRHARTMNVSRPKHKVVRKSAPSLPLCNPNHGTPEGKCSSGYGVMSTHDKKKPKKRGRSIELSNTAEANDLMSNVTKVSDDIAQSNDTKIARDVMPQTAAKIVQDVMQPTTSKVSNNFVQSSATKTSDNIAQSNSTQVAKDIVQSDITKDSDDIVQSNATKVILQPTSTKVSNELVQSSATKVPTKKVLPNPTKSPKDIAQPNAIKGSKDREQPTTESLSKDKNVQPTVSGLLDDTVQSNTKQISVETYDLPEEDITETQQILSDSDNIETKVITALNMDPMDPADKDITGSPADRNGQNTSLEINFNRKELSLNLLNLSSSSSQGSWCASDDGSSSSLTEEDTLNMRLNILNRSSSSNEDLKGCDKMTQSSAKKDVFLVSKYNDVALLCEEMLSTFDDGSSEVTQPSEQRGPEKEGGSGDYRLNNINTPNTPSIHQAKEVDDRQNKVPYNKPSEESNASTGDQQRFTNDNNQVTDVANKSHDENIDAFNSSVKDESRNSTESSLLKSPSSPKADEHHVRADVDNESSGEEAADARVEQDEESSEEEADGASSVDKSKIRRSKQQPWARSGYSKRRCHGRRKLLDKELSHSNDNVTDEDDISPETPMESPVRYHSPLQLRLTARKHFPPKTAVGHSSTESKEAPSSISTNDTILSSCARVDSGLVSRKAMMSDNPPFDKKVLPSRVPHGQRIRDQSLRQTPAKVVRFQAGETPKQRNQQQQQQDPKRKFREVAKPSLVKSLDDNTTGGHSSIQEYELHQPEKTSDKKETPHNDKPTAKAWKRKAIGPAIPEGKYTQGTLVWGKMKGFTWWPACVIHHHECGRTEAPSPDLRWVKWYGDNKFSQLGELNLAPFEEFDGHFNSNYYRRVLLYRRALYEVTVIAAKRANKTLQSNVPDIVQSGGIPKSSEDKEAFTIVCDELLEWVKGGFQPTGPEAIGPSADDQQIPKVPSPAATPPPSPPAPSSKPTTSTSKSPGKSPGKSPRKNPVYEDHRDIRMDDLKSGKLKIEDMCIGCGELKVEAEHPLFEGGICSVCRVEFIEVSYLFDSDGYQSYCCICAEGSDIVLCGQTGCNRSFCLDCIDLLVAPGESKKVIHQDPWCCYMCTSNPKQGFLIRRDNWTECLLKFFADDREAEYKQFQMYPALSVADRRPIRVLSLFDGIGTAMLVLKELGFKVECYYASEINKDAITVASVRHEGVIQHIGDVRTVDMRKLESLGPIDLLIGGSPCNDLSFVNPARRGLYATDSTGRLFFDFYRILKCLEANKSADSERPFFWLFENVVFMARSDKLDISRFFECNPVLVDAKDLSPAHRARYFWGNLPGMSRPSIAAAENTLELQDVLEKNCNRQAQFTKVRTITTRSNSIKQKEQFLPVMMDGQEDTLWCTEMERIFGFPEHYTDVANLNRTKRHQLLGQAWNVPVIKHLLAPLTDYYRCETQEHDSSSP